MSHANLKHYTMIRAYRGIVPKIASSCYIDPSAQVIGDVVIGERSSVWPLVTIRGDVHHIRIGEETNVQDNSVLHVDGPLYPLHIGNRVTVGHQVCLHGCTVEDDALIGIGAIVLNGARIGKGSIVAAGSLVPEGKEIPDGMMAMGVPAKVVRAVTPEEAERFRANCQHYVAGRAIYREEPS
ncbi:gamma carbonic anhydrase family protein [Bryobacter aggregatus]|uniref:gamma carbonic anhydrase family protein n=1 Tax=Bryobacter aggregatus TaxID=360054 RepID=UPI001EE1B1FF|nr:gamma carbonic anhydrase family protein [Bryobacter aggregatus]